MILNKKYLLIVLIDCDCIVRYAYISKLYMYCTNVVLILSTWSTSFLHVPVGVREIPMLSFISVLIVKVQYVSSNSWPKKRVRWQFNDTFICCISAYVVCTIQCVIFVGYSASVDSYVGSWLHRPLKVTLVGVNVVHLSPYSVFSVKNLQRAFSLSKLGFY